MIGSFIMYGGFLLNKFFAIIVANKIRKGLWIGACYSHNILHRLFLYHKIHWGT